MTLLVNEAANAQNWTANEREEWLDEARATWRSFEVMTGSTGLTADRLEQDDRGAWKPSNQTSPTDIACYLWATLSARSLGIIDDAQADRKLGTTLTTLERMDRSHGFFFNLYETRSGARADNQGQIHHPSAFLSSVDNGWLAAALTMIRNTRPSLRDRAENLIKPMDFRFFFVPYDPVDPVNHSGQIHGGYYTDDRTFSAFYGMLNTEPRIISYLAIARGQIPDEHYYRLFRTLPVDRGPQSQVPKGKFRTYEGISVFEGHYEYRDLDLVPTWGGSMFEALMVPLFVPEEQWAPRSWGINHPLYVRAQIDQGMIVRRYGYWGFSPSWTPNRGYQTYGVFGIGTEVDGYRSYENLLGAKPDRSRPVGPVFEGIVTPHASFLALRYEPRESLANIRALRKSFPIFDPNIGFLDSVNVTTGEVSHCVLSLDQGMILASIANTLTDDSLRRALCDAPFEAKIRRLIEPEEFTAGNHRR